MKKGWPSEARPKIYMFLTETVAENAPPTTSVREGPGGVANPGGVQGGSHFCSGGVGNPPEPPCAQVCAQRALPTELLEVGTERTESDSALVRV